MSSRQLCCTRPPIWLIFVTLPNHETDRTEWNSGNNQAPDGPTELVQFYHVETGNNSRGLRGQANTKRDQTDGQTREQYLPVVFKLKLLALLLFLHFPRSHVGIVGGAATNRTAGRSGHLQRIGSADETNNETAEREGQNTGIDPRHNHRDHSGRFQSGKGRFLGGTLRSSINQMLPITESLWQLGSFWRRLLGLLRLRRLRWRRFLAHGIDDHWVLNDADALF